MLQAYQQIHPLSQTENRYQTLEIFKFQNDEN